MRAGAKETKSSAPAVKRGKGPKIRAARFEDYDQIATLESRYGINPKGRENWKHLWLGNPAYRELQPGWDIGWVVENEDARIVASVGNIPLWYEFEGRRILAASGRAQVAEPEYRSAAMLLLDRVINQRGVDVYLNNTVSATSAASFQAFECSRVPVGIWDQSAYWITGRRGFFASILARKSKALAVPLSYPCSATAAVFDWIRSKGVGASDVEVTACESFDERFDAFWDDLKRHNPGRLLALRTREALEWHFKSALLQNQLWIATVTNGPRLAAYAIFCHRDNPKFGLKRVWLVDFQSVDGGLTLLWPVLAWGLRKCRELGVHMLESIGRWLDDRQFISNAAPHRRTLGTWTFFYGCDNPEFAKRLTERSAWASASLYDGDATL